MADTTLAAEMRAALAREQRSQAWLAEKAQISTSALARKLRGETSFTIEELIRCSRALGLNAADLLAEAAA